MTQEKLRQVVISDYDQSWPEKFNTAAADIKRILGSHCLAVQHIGSTAVPQLAAKPIIDMQVVVDRLQHADACQSAFNQLGYTAMGEYGIHGRRFYYKGASNRTHHIHLFAEHDTEIKRHLAFRDYLRQHPSVATGYGTIKKALAQQFPADIEHYIKGKDSFIRTIDYWAGVAKADQLNASDDIVLQAYDPAWQKLAAAEIAAIQQHVKLDYALLEHLGSTALSGMTAKPIIDLFIGLNHMQQAEKWTAALHDLGYIDWPDNPNPQHLRYFKGMPPYGIARTHHIHIMPMGDELQRRIAFKEKLQKEPALRQAYLQLKLDLSRQHNTDREAYTRAKADFIKQHC